MVIASSSTVFGGTNASGNARFERTGGSSEPRSGVSVRLLNDWIGCERRKAFRPKKSARYSAPVRIPIRAVRNVPGGWARKSCIERGFELSLGREASLCAGVRVRTCKARMYWKILFEKSSLLILNV